MKLYYESNSRATSKSNQTETDIGSSSPRKRMTGVNDDDDYYGIARSKTTLVSIIC